MLRYLDMILVLEPSSPPDRWERAVLRYRLAQPEGAAEDLRWLLEHPTPGVDTRQIEELLRGLRR
jgi:regulator of sirC expression with transglutaminase-like and TPR domain